MPMPDLGATTTAMLDAPEGSPPAVISEWLSHLRHSKDVIFLWAGASRQLSWIHLSTHLSDGERDRCPVADTSAVSIERLLSPLAHEGRVRIMQALYRGRHSASELGEATGFRGGGLYHHLRELRYAAYVTEDGGRYSLTELGRQLLITVALIADEVVVDRAEEGLAAGADWTRSPGS